MSFDLAELQSKVNNYTTVVGSWMKNVGNLYFSATPQNVSVKLLDENGNVKTNTIPNAAQFRKRVWDDVGGALGQFNKIVYVDAINGNDTNDGTIENPLKTFKKACGLVPNGGYGYIGLFGDQTHEISSDFSVRNKYIYINGTINKTDKNAILKNKGYSENSYNYTTGMYSYKSKFIFYSCDIQTANLMDNALPLHSYSGMFKKVSNLGTSAEISFVFTEVNIGDTSFANVHVASNIFDFSLFSTTINNNGVNKNGHLVWISGGVVSITTSSVTLGTKQDDTTPLTWEDTVAGITKDTNGVPRNVISNIVF